MGHYTDVKAELEVIPHEADKIKLLLACGNWQAVASADARFAEYAAFSRANFIPFGTIDTKVLPTFDGKTLRFHCSLKNYDGTIGKFLELLPTFAYKGKIDLTNDDMRFRDVWHHYEVRALPMGSEVIDLGWDKIPDIDRCFGF